MEQAALVTWILTAAAGVLIVLMWLARGGAGRAADDAPDEAVQEQITARGFTRWSYSAVIVHASLAIVGLFFWFLFVGNWDDPDYSPAPWVMLLVLLIVVVLGMGLFRRWALDRQAAQAGAAAGEGRRTPAEQSLPPALVLLHGVGALVTLALVLAVAIAT